MASSIMKNEEESHACVNPSPTVVASVSDTRSDSPQQIEASPPNVETAGSVRVVSGSGFRYVVPFPYRLHKMLSDVEVADQTSIVSWLPCGMQFKVHDATRFVQTIIPVAFKQKSLKSFQRQLHLYGFQRNSQEGPCKGAYFHESFLRDHRDLCLSIARIKAPRRSRAAVAAASAKKMVCTHSAAASSSIQGSATTATKSVPLLATLDNIASLRSSMLTAASTSFSNRKHQSAGSLTAPVSSPSSSRQCHQVSWPQTLAGASSYTSTKSATDTYEWLINAGVPLTAFDPVVLRDASGSKVSSIRAASFNYTPQNVESQLPAPMASNASAPVTTATVEETAPGVGSELWDCAQEITSLFSSSPWGPSPHTTSSSSSSNSSYGAAIAATSPKVPGARLPTPKIISASSFQQISSVQTPMDLLLEQNITTPFDDSLWNL